MSPTRARPPWVSRAPEPRHRRAAGWSEAAVEEMVKTYAHTGMGALNRIKAAGEGGALPILRDADRDAHEA
jgi:hypothetical protein